MNWNKILENEDVAVINKHECQDNNDINSYFILHCVYPISNSSKWLLVKLWIADWEEVADGEAEKIGDIMSSWFFQIFFCPFCGDELSIDL